MHLRSYCLFFLLPSFPSATAEGDDLAASSSLRGHPQRRILCSGGSQDCRAITGCVWQQGSCQPAEPAGGPPPATPAPQPPAPTTCATGGESCKNGPLCCESFTCTNMGQGRRECVGPTTPNPTSPATPNPTPPPVNPPTGGCPACLNVITNAQCDSCNTNGLPLECPGTDRPTSVLQNYWNSDITTCGSATPCTSASVCNSSWCCSDGAGGYYLGGFCAYTQGTICCPVGQAWTNAQCQPLNCCDGADTSRCVTGSC